MKTQRFVIEQLLGMSPLRSPGSSELRPRILERFSFSRPEGYEAINQNPISQDPADWLNPAAPANFESAIGRDGTGLASILRANGDLSLTRRLTLLGDTTPSGAVPSGLEYTHIGAFGAYASLSYFGGVDLDDDVFGPVGIEPPEFVLDTIAPAQGGEAIAFTGSGDVPTHAEVACYHSGTNQWLAVVGDQLYLSNPDDYTTWDNAAVTLPVSGTWRDMHSDGNVIIIVGNSNTNVRCDGDPSDVGNWATLSIGPHDISGIASAGARWVAATSDSDSLYYSTDSAGQFWAEAVNVVAGFGVTQVFNKIAYDSLTGHVAASEGDNTTFKQLVQVSVDGVDYETPGETELAAVTYKGIASNNDGTFVTFGDQAFGFASQGGYAWSFDGGVTWGVTAYERGFQWVEWNGSSFIAAGHDEQMGSSGVAVSDDGSSWSNQTSNYDLDGVELGMIAVSTSGQTIVWAKNSGSPTPAFIAAYGTVGVGGQQRFQPGDYEIIWLATVPTKAGKVVVASGTWKMAIRGGGTGLVSVTTPEAPAALDGSLRYEFYFRYAPEEEDEATGQFIVGDITGREYILSAVVDEGVTEEEIYYPEIGRTLPDVGNVGTSAVNGVAAYHQDRIWYKPSAIEAQYAFLRGEAAIDSLARPMTVGFTELEYLNLVGESFYLHLPPGNSTEITGMVSSPSGLMVFGDNDAYLISGDPAIPNSLNVEPFPDSVGCDQGFEPATLAGLVFVVWRNRLYALDGAQAQNISWGVLDRQSAILNIATDAATNTIAVQTTDAVLHYDLEKGEWYQSEYMGTYNSRTAFHANARLLPSPEGMCFFLYDTIGAIATYDTAGAPSAQPSIIEWRGIDAGDSLRRDYWRYVRIPVDVESADFEIDESSVAATLYWRTRPEQPAVETMNASYAADGHILNGELVFQIPWGYPSRHVDLRLVMAADQRVAIQPGIAIGHAPGPSGDLIP